MHPMRARTKAALLLRKALLSEMDEFDRASELEMASRNAAIAAQRVKITKVSYSHCLDCGDAIPQARQAFGGVLRCIACQQFLEEKARHYAK